MEAGSCHARRQRWTTSTPGVCRSLQSGGRGDSPPLPSANRSHLGHTNRVVAPIGKKGNEKSDVASNKGSTLRVRNDAARAKTMGSQNVTDLLRFPGNTVGDFRECRRITSESTVICSVAGDRRRSLQSCQAGTAQGDHCNRKSLECLPDWDFLHIRQNRNCLS